MFVKFNAKVLCTNSEAENIVRLHDMSALHCEACVVCSFFFYTF